MNDLLRKLADLRSTVDLEDVFEDDSTKTACCADMGETVSE